MKNKQLFLNKTVLELGSGIGLTGLCVALNCNPSRIALTDCHQSVLNSLCANVNLNTISKHCKETTCTTSRCLLSKTINGSTVLEVLNLPWEQVDEEFYKERAVDVILAADVVFDSSLFSPLLKCVKCFFIVCEKTEMVLACTERNKKTLEVFLQLLGM